MMQVRIELAAVVLAALFITTNQALSQVLDAAVVESQRTGKPILAICTSESCPPCRALKQRFATDPEIQQLANTHFVPINLDVGTPDFKTWAAKFGMAGKGIPMIYFVSATGEVLHKQSGAPSGQGLNRLLLQVAAQAGPAVANQGAVAKKGPNEEMVAAVREANQLITARKIPQAVEVIVPYADQIKAAARSNQPAEKLLVRIFNELNHGGEASLRAAKKKLADDEKQFFGLLALMKTRREYGALPAVGPKVDAELDAFRDDPKMESWLKQAEMIDEGRAAETPDDNGDAIAKYRKVIQAYPHSIGSKLCSMRIEQLDAGEVSTESQPTSEPNTVPYVPPQQPNREVSPEQREQAAADLKMANLYADSWPDMAREYAQKVITVAPGTPEAAEARQLLERLGMWIDKPR
jgi:thiol-disulfide isomerase/thioredoxin